MNRNRRLPCSTTNVSPRLRLARAALLTTLLCSAASAPAATHAERPVPNWTLESALQAASNVDAVARLKPLFALARAGDDGALLDRLRQLADDDSLPAPARERVLQEFARGLSDLPARRPTEALAAWLLAWRPRTLVPHEESPAAGVPLYNVAAAAAGSFNAWERQLAAGESQRLLDAGANAWLAAWLAGNPAQRAGMVDALAQTAHPQLAALAGATLERLPATPELGGVAAQIALALPDPELFGTAAATGTTYGLSNALRRAGMVFDPAEQATILERAVREAVPANASLIIAELGPGLSDRPEIEQLLFGLLGDMQLGASASMVLAHSTDPSVAARLDELADSGQSLAAHRAALALDLRRGGQQARYDSELQP